jgi:hypothetical protein
MKVSPRSKQDCVDRGTYGASSRRTRPQRQQILAQDLGEVVCFVISFIGNVAIMARVRFLETWFGKKKQNPIEDGNPALVRAMEGVAANDSPENRKKLYDALLNAMLLIPVPAIPAGLSLEPGIQTIEEGVDIRIVGLHDAKGVCITPAFTDVEALRNWDPNTPYIGVRSADLFRFLLDKEAKDVLINPFDPIRKMIRAGGRVTRREIEQLAQGVAPTNTGIQQFHFKEGEKVFIGLPANPPSAAVQELLRSKATEIAEIADVYFFQMVRGSTPSIVVGVGLSQNVSEDRKRQIMQSLGSAIRGQVPRDQFLDFMFLQGGFGDHIRKIGGLIFRR